MAEYDFVGITPVPVGEEARWFEHCRDHRLTIQRCRECARHFFPPRSICPHCLAADPEWVDAMGTGTIYTFTVQYREPRGFDGQAPFTIAMVELDEGVRLMTRIPGAGAGLSIGDRVEVGWADVADDVTVPVFVPLRGPSSGS